MKELLKVAFWEMFDHLWYGSPKYKAKVMKERARRKLENEKQPKVHWIVKVQKRVVGGLCRVKNALSAAVSVFKK